MNKATTIDAETAENHFSGVPAITALITANTITAEPAGHAEKILSAVSASSALIVADTIPAEPAEPAERAENPPVHVVASPCF